MLCLVFRRECIRVRSCGNDAAAHTVSHGAFFSEETKTRRAGNKMRKVTFTRVLVLFVFCYFLLLLLLSGRRTLNAGLLHVTETSYILVLALAPNVSALLPPAAHVM